MILRILVFFILSLTAIPAFAEECDAILEKLQDATSVDASLKLLKPLFKDLDAEQKLKLVKFIKHRVLTENLPGSQAQLANLESLHRRFSLDKIFYDKDVAKEFHLEIRHLQTVLSHASQKYLAAVSGEQRNYIIESLGLLVIAPLKFKRSLGESEEPELFELLNALARDLKFDRDIRKAAVDTATLLRSRDPEAVEARMYSNFLQAEKELADHLETLIEAIIEKDFLKLSYLDDTLEKLAKVKDFVSIKQLFLTVRWIANFCGGNWAVEVRLQQILRDWLLIVEATTKSDEPWLAYESQEFLLRVDPLRAHTDLVLYLLNDLSAATSEHNAKEMIRILFQLSRSFNFADEKAVFETLLAVKSEVAKLSDRFDPYDRELIAAFANAAFTAHQEILRENQYAIAFIASVASDSVVVRRSMRKLNMAVKIAHRMRTNFED